mmetsp:Transcript_14675/g.14774  ORF Transcript_14675/g.14774 Transcript_14675/m.14774 type:complete len:467 (+) Transcript_14675:185-1585(+)|eukprot:CAMPEP_0182426220 /NCGR_PEP_ID=MMETSP1167-20130531/12720_1 /TAXON_ID=2988 /ORGANISM="Mallomonas Sp, Strain CCMP3275" /LENGTH=466 /DNA_ID=CAMNT_0024607513 /DNA_START=156 /DNA_END=1556 /DNA_ORIENTATION=+
MHSYIALYILFCIINFSSSETAIADQKDDSRPQSMFKVGPGSDDWLALPEVFSNLDFSADSTPAKEEDIEGQMRLRSTRFWGRLYLDGWPQTIQYFRAHFGIEPPFGRKTFVFAEPRDACTDLENAKYLTSSHVVFVNRGVCTFGTKAKNIHKTNASAVIIINNEPGIEHLPGPDAHDIQFSVMSIPQQEGQLLELTYDDVPSPSSPPSSSVSSAVFGRELQGYIVPINCQTGQAKCLPATFEERKNIAHMIDGGIVQMHSSSSSASEGTSTSTSSDFESMEYLLAHFGSKVPHPEKEYQILSAEPRDACSALENDVKGKVVLAMRGTCSFVKKAEAVQSAGGAALVIGSLDNVIVRMGVEPRWKGLNTVIPVVMISNRSYSAFTSDPSRNITISFQEHRDVSAAVWESLEKLYSSDGWPRSEAYIIKKLNELKTQHLDWPDRLVVIEEAYNKISKTSSASVKTEL